jgi:DNA invertase Pin-like site-specific DNA recombinase
MTYGYARVSTRDQSPQLQLDALRLAGCDEILVETGSGAKKDRPVLVALLARLVPSDTLISWKLDRVGRSAQATLEILDSLRSRGIVYRSLTEGLDTSTTIGKFGLTMLAAVAEMERELLLERIHAGIRASRKQHGRPPQLHPDTLEQARSLMTEGASLRKTARTLRIPLSTLHDTLRRGAAPASALKSR